MVIVDGKRYGQTPQTIELSEGRHRVTVENEGLDRKETFSVTLKPGQKKTIFEHAPDSHGARDYIRVVEWLKNGAAALHETRAA